MTTKQMRALADFADAFGKAAVEAGANGLSFPVPLVVHLDDGTERRSHGAAYTIWVDDGERVVIEEQS